MLKESTPWIDSPERAAVTHKILNQRVPASHFPQGTPARFWAEIVLDPATASPAAGAWYRVAIAEALAWRRKNAGSSNQENQ